MIVTVRRMVSVHLMPTHAKTMFDAAADAWICPDMERRQDLQVLPGDGAMKVCMGHKDQLRRWDGGGTILAEHGGDACKAKETYTVMFSTGTCSGWHSQVRSSLYRVREGTRSTRPCVRLCAPLIDSSPGGSSRKIRHFFLTFQNIFNFFYFFFFFQKLFVTLFQLTFVI